MGTRAYYSEEEPTFRRYGPRGQSYSLAQEHPEHPHASRSYSDGRNGDHGQENEPGHQMRRRIQVAVCHQFLCPLRCESIATQAAFADQFFHSVNVVESAKFDAVAKAMADPVTIAKIPAVTSVYS